MQFINIAAVSSANDNARANRVRGMENSKASPMLKMQMALWANPRPPKRDKPFRGAYFGIVER